MSVLDFSAYAQRIASENNAQFMLPVIEKELLHYEILQSMEDGGLLSGLIFQGGTCLRLCYGASRFCEDLDFAGGIGFDAKDLNELRKCLTDSLPSRYSVDVAVKEPKDNDALIKKWSIVINTRPQKTGLPFQRISLEVASIPAYTKQPRMLQINYQGLPSAFGDIILFSESLEEILADKLEAFVCSSYIRHRDIWDMYWIMRRPGIDLNEALDLRAKKEIDFGEQDKFKEGLVRVTEQLDSIVNSHEFGAQMKRFLPADLHEKTVGSEDFRMLMAKSIKSLYFNNENV